MVVVKVVSEYVGQSIVNNVVFFFFKKSCFFPRFSNIWIFKYFLCNEYFAYVAGENPAKYLLEMMVLKLVNMLFE